MAGFVTITPLVIGADGSGTTQNTVQAAINDLAGKAQVAVNGVTGGRGVLQVLAQSAVPASVTGTASETVLATIAIPAGAMGPNGMLRISTLWTVTNSVNNKALRVKLAGNNLSSVGTTTVASFRGYSAIQNRGVTNSQVGFTTGSITDGGSSGANATFAVDMSVAQTLTITGQLTNTGETITLEYYTVELLNP